MMGYQSSVSERTVLALRVRSGGQTATDIDQKEYGRLLSRPPRRWGKVNTAQRLQ